MEWINDISRAAREIMAWMGNFSPTVHAKDRQVKGYIADSNTGDGGKEYCTSADLRGIAAACTEVADWLDKRAETEAPPSNA